VLGICEFSYDYQQLNAFIGVNFYSDAVSTEDRTIVDVVWSVGGSEFIA